MQELEAPFRVVSATTGKPLLEVLEQVDGCTGLFLYNAAGKCVVALVAEEEEGAGEVWVNHADGGTRISVEACEEGGAVRIYPPEMKGCGLDLAATDGHGMIAIGRPGNAPFVLGREPQ